MTRNYIESQIGELERVAEDLGTELAEQGSEGPALWVGPAIYNLNISIECLKAALKFAPGLRPGTEAPR